MSAELAFLLNKLSARVPGNLSAGTGGISTSFSTPTGQTVTILNGLITNSYGGGVGAASPINAEWFSNLADQFGAATVCSTLQADVNATFAQLQDFQNDINAQIALLAPVLALITAPEANPVAIVTWITSFITDFLKPYLVPYATYATQLTELAAQVSTLSTAIENAAANIEGCSVTIPPLT